MPKWLVALSLIHNCFPFMLVGEGITAAPYQKIDIWEPAKYKQTNNLNNHA